MLTFKMVHAQQLYVNVSTKAYYLSAHIDRQKEQRQINNPCATFLDNKHHMKPNQSTKRLYSKIGCRKEKKKWKEGNHGGVASGVRRKQTR
jgi:hypothetical protein